MSALIAAGVVLVAVFAALLPFPRTLKLLEATGFYVCTPEYLHTTLAVYPGVNTLLSNWLLQFFIHPVAGAAIEAALLGLIAWLAAWAPRGWGMSMKPVLAALPAAGLFVAFPHAVSLYLEAALVFALIGLYGFIIRRRKPWLTIGSLMVIALVSFVMLSFPATAILMLTLSVLTASGGRAQGRYLRILLCALPLIMIGVVAVLVLISSNTLSFIPQSERWWYVSGAGDRIWLYLCVYVVGVLSWLIPTVRKRNVDLAITAAVSVAAGLFLYFHTTGNAQALTSERFYRYAEMADNGRWRSLLDDIRQEGPITDKTRLQLALLCEERLHTLPDNLFSYPINTPEDFLPRFDSAPYSKDFCRIFYQGLGLWDEAYHRAYEYAMEVNKNYGFCMASLRHMALYTARQGDVPTAEKLIYLLKRTTLNREYADALADTLRAAPVYKDTIRADNFVGGYAFNSEMVRLLEMSPNNRDFLDYLLCGLLLQKKLEIFSTIIHAFPLYKDTALPRAYAEAAAMIEMLRPGAMRDVFRYDPSYDEQVRRFQQLRQEGGDDSAFQGTFWYYYVYAEIPEPLEWNPQAASS